MMTCQAYLEEKAYELGELCDGPDVALGLVVEPRVLALDRHHLWRYTHTN